MAAKPAGKAPGSNTENTATGYATRLLARSNSIAFTAGHAPSYLQANVLILPAALASDFRLFCQRNPVPSPLLAESAQPGSPSSWKSHLPGIPDEAIAASCDIRTDIPRYAIYRDGQLHSQCSDISDLWTSDHVAFLLGCSMSFESALTKAGLEPRHISMDIVNPMYKTNIRTCPAGVFVGGHYIVSMRAYRRSELDRVRNITRPYVATHGEPIAWGWDGMRALGIENIDRPDWGDPPRSRTGGSFGESEQVDGPEDDIPVFWGCGVTSQQAVMSAKIPGLVLSHAPGYMLVLDVKEEDIFRQ